MTDVLSRLTAALAGKYDIERELGTGGMVTVYLAEDVKHRRWPWAGPSSRPRSSRLVARSS